MATTKNTPETKSTEQRGKDTSFGNTTGRANPNTQPGDRATNEETRNAGLPGTHRKGAENTQMGTNDRGSSSTSAPNKQAGDRTDREVAGGRTTGQNPTDARDTNDGELRDEDEEDNEALPGSEDLETEGDAADTDDAADDEAATTVK